MIFSNNKVLETIAFASKKHEGQTYGPLGLSYLQGHLMPVAELALRAAHGDTDTFIVALLHDTLEDTQTTLVELQEIFGRNISQDVLTLTDDPSLSKKEQKKQQVVKIQNMDFRPRVVKMADKIVNTQNVVHAPWRLSSKIGYTNGNKQVIDAVRGTSVYLEDMFDRIYNHTVQMLQNTAG